MSNQYHRLGILHKIDPRFDLDVEVRKAILDFQTRSHTRGHIPEEVHFHSTELPAESCIQGLIVKYNPDVRPGYLRVCTKLLTPLEELAAEVAGPVHVLST